VASHELLRRNFRIADPFSSPKRRDFPFGLQMTGIRQIMDAPVFIRSRALWRGLPLVAALGALALGGCAQSPTATKGQRHAKEYFPEAIYGRASPRVIADGEPVPKGGGQYLVGKPYSVAGRTYVPSERKVAGVGLASWYGDAFHGRRTANGEVYDKDGVTAAHPTMPLPSYARVTNLRNHRSIIVRVNDRGPYHSNRVMDLSATAAEALAYKSVGTTKIKVEYVGRASLNGSDDRKLLATLRTDGQAAQLDDFAFSGTRMAEQQDDLPAKPARIDRVMERLALTQPDNAQPAPAEAPKLAEAAQAQSQIESPVKPQRVAMLETDAEEAQSAALPRLAPPPPQRPFDLGVARAAMKPFAYKPDGLKLDVAKPIAAKPVSGKADAKPAQGKPEASKAAPIKTLAAKAEIAKPGAGKATAPKIAALSPVAGQAAVDKKAEVKAPSAKATSIKLASAKPAATKPVALARR
jgi:rare lipoprotein A